MAIPPINTTPVTPPTSFNVRPSSPPLVTFAQMQAQLRIDTDDEEDLVNDLVDAATEYAESALDASLLIRTLQTTFDDHNSPPDFAFGATRRRRLNLPGGPVQSIVSVVDANGSAVTNTFGRTGVLDWIEPCGTFTGPITVTYVAGYGSNVTDVPADIRMAIRTHVATLYMFPESVSDERRLLQVPQSLAAFYALKRRSVPVA